MNYEWFPGRALMAALSGELNWINMMAIGLLRQCRVVLTHPEGLGRRIVPPFRLTARSPWQSADRSMHACALRYLAMFATRQ